MPGLDLRWVAIAMIVSLTDRASASFYFALVNLTKECNISLVKCQMA